MKQKMVIGPDGLLPITEIEYSIGPFSHKPAFAVFRQIWYGKKGSLAVGSGGSGGAIFEAPTREECVAWLEAHKEQERIGKGLLFEIEPVKEVIR